MGIAAGIMFFLSLSGIIALFTLKYREEEHGRVFAPALKERGDAHALDLKDFIAQCRAEVATWPPRVLVALQVAVHRGALLFAAFARTLERRSHELADRVSHKHGFERRQTSSEFLRQVGEYKNGTNEHVDIR